MVEEACDLCPDHIYWDHIIGMLIVYCSRAQQGGCFEQYELDWMHGNRLCPTSRQMTYRVTLYCYFNQNKRETSLLNRYVICFLFLCPGFWVISLIRPCPPKENQREKKKRKKIRSFLQKDTLHQKATQSKSVLQVFKSNS